MKTKFPYLLTMAAMVLAASYGCKKEDQDTTAPIIKSALLNNADHDILATAGEELHIDAEVTDDEALGELKIDIHNIFDGHGHKRNFARWSEVITLSLSGKEQVLHEHTDIPANATAGPYHAIFRLIDAAGNEADFVEIDFMITNGTEPVIDLTDPDFSNEVHAPRGTDLILRGTVTDDNDLEEIIIRLAAADHNHKVHVDEIYEADFDLPGANDTSWDFETDGQVVIAIPNDAEEGYYLLQVVAIDNDGNMAIFEGEVHIH